MPTHSDVPNYFTVVSQPPKTPPRKFCAVCGYNYDFLFFIFFRKPCNMSCIRCGTKFCSFNCQKFHNDTKCLKFGTI